MKTTTVPTIFTAAARNLLPTFVTISLSSAFSVSSSSAATGKPNATCPSSTKMMTNPPLNVKVIPQNKLHVSEPDPVWFGNGPNEGSNPAWTNDNWLKSRFHFSFAEYHSSANSQFGVMRVMNDDLVQPHRGFGTHPHGNMEIITYIVEGELTHEDSMGTKESLGRGSIQFMTAGTGIRHSEFNHGDKPLRFIQTWITPSQAGLTPNYGSYRGDPKCHKNKLHHLVSNVHSNDSTPVQINQDVNGYASELELGQKVVHGLGGLDQMAYLLCIEGSVKVNGKKLQKYDACEITPATRGGEAGENNRDDSGAGNAAEVVIEATDVEETEHGDVAHVLMFTMNTVPNAGRTDC